MLVSIKQWSDRMISLGISKSKQSGMLGSNDVNDIHRLLRQPERLMVDEDTHELWRKVRRNHEEPEEKMVQQDPVSTDGNDTGSDRIPDWYCRV